MNDTAPRVFRIHCHFDLTVLDAGQLSQLAAEDLRQADIDWSQEADDLETACQELVDKPGMALAGLLDPQKMFVGLPISPYCSATLWAEELTPERSERDHDVWCHGVPSPDVTSTDESPLP
jgi:hypothetical protein